MCNPSPTDLYFKVSNNLQNTKDTLEASQTASESEKSAKEEWVLVIIPSDF